MGEAPERIDCDVLVVGAGDVALHKALGVQGEPRPARAAEAALDRQGDQIVFRPRPMRRRRGFDGPIQLAHEVFGAPSKTGLQLRGEQLRSLLRRADARARRYDRT